MSKRELIPYTIKDLYSAMFNNYKVKINSAGIYRWWRDGKWCSFLNGHDGGMYQFVNDYLNYEAIEKG